MTVASSTSKVTFNGNGVTTSWPFDFPVKDGSHIQVIVTSPAGAETTLFNGYTVTLNGNGGSVTYPTSGTPLAAGHKITLRRVVPLTQETDLANQGGFYAETHEDRFDLLVMADQQQQEQLDRAVKAPVSDTSPFDLPTAAVRASKLLGFQSDGRPRASSVTLEAVEAAATASAVAGKVIAVIPPVTSDGSLFEVDTGYTLASAAQVDAVVGGINQAGKFTVSGTKVVFPEAVTTGEEVHIRILGVSPDAPTGGDVAYTPALPLGAVASGGASPNSAAVDHVHPIPTAADVGAAAVSHTHTVADTAGLQAALDGKAATNHTHTVADTAGLQAALDGKAASNLANVSNLDFANKAAAAGIGGGSGGPLAMAGVVVVSAAYTVTAADAGKLLRCVAGLTLTMTSAAVLGVGFTLAIRSETSGDVVVSAVSGQTINGVAGVPLILRPGQSILLVSDGSSGWRSVGQQVTTDYTWDRGTAAGWLALSADGYIGSTSYLVGYKAVRSAAPIPTEKVYWEIILNNVSSTERRVGVSGIAVTAPIGTATGWELGLHSGNIRHNNVETTYSTAYGETDIVGVACHLGTGKIWFAKNNVWQGGGNPAAGASPAFANLSGNLYVAASVYYTNQSIDLRARRSQMTYAPPSGFAPLAG